MPYLYSTLSCSQRYVKYAPAVAGGVPREERSVFVAGGANVANKNLITPRGVVTEVTDEELALLRENDLFKIHVSKGHIVVEDRKHDVEKVIPDMEARSPDAQIEPQDYDVSGTHTTDGVKVTAKKKK